MAKIIYWFECWVQKKGKHDFEKGFFKLINNLVFGKMLENVRKHIDNKLVIAEKKAIGVRTKLSYKKVFLKCYYQ